MCHDDISRPPAPPRSVPVTDHRGLTLKSADETDFSAFYATSDIPQVGVVILPDVRGLHPFYGALAERFAEAGLASVAIDYFARTAGMTDSGWRPEDFDWQTHIKDTNPTQVNAETQAAMDYLRQQHGVHLPIISVGFCFGGGQVWRQASSDLDLSAVVGFYGRPDTVGRAAKHSKKHTIMFIAGADFTPVEDQLALAEEMRLGGAEVETVVYDGAPHSFFDRAFDEWSEVCTDVWARILELTDRIALERASG
ncbi:MAG: dienelactone hydrolase family protein [Candidatus Nanopelagicales bacterium]|nr:dienelactone hydrolase family protein [Candidatus Nanopelagicales bacterium]